MPKTEFFQKKKNAAGRSIKINFKNMFYYFSKFCFPSILGRRRRKSGKLAIISNPDYLKLNTLSIIGPSLHCWSKICFGVSVGAHMVPMSRKGWTEKDTEILGLFWVYFLGLWGSRWGLWGLWGAGQTNDSKMGQQFSMSGPKKQISGLGWGGLSWPESDSARKIIFKNVGDKFPVILFCPKTKMFN